MAAAAPPTQHEDAAAATVSAVNGTGEKKAGRTAEDSGAPKSRLMARRAIAKSETLKAAITHRPKTSSPLKACISAEPPALPARNGSPMLNVTRFAVQAGN